MDAPCLRRVLLSAAAVGLIGLAPAAKAFAETAAEPALAKTADDAGLAWAIGRSKPDFVGKRSLERATMKSPRRRQLVGLRTADPAVVLEEGAQLVDVAGQRPPMQPIGHVTSSYHSPSLGHSIALAMVVGGRARKGQTLYVPMPAGEVPVTITPPVFYDPEGARLHV